MAQEKHFVFIQTDNRLVFNVNLNGKIYSSNASGFIIIPQLPAGSYNMVIGFASNTFPSQAFSFNIAQKDLGFNLKNFDDKGWALLNLQTLDMTMASAPPANIEATLRAEDEPISFNRKNQTISKPTLGNDSVAGKPSDSLVTVALSDSPKVNTTAANNNVAIITKLDEKKNEEGIDMAFTDANGGAEDTIQLTIPTTISKEKEVNLSPEDSAIAAKIALLNQRQDEVKTLEIDMSAKDSVVQGQNEILADNAGENIKNDTSALASEANENKEKKESKSKRRRQERKQKKLDESQLNAVLSAEQSPVVTDERANEIIITDTTAVISSPIVNEVNNPPAGNGTAAFCASEATEEDYIKLRRRMALQDNDEKMIREAKKIFKDKCFTTRQVKGLSTLFLSDEGRFRFFTSSYSFVSDPGSYPVLQSEFIDPFYLNRFKSLVQ